MVGYTLCLIFLRRGIIWFVVVVVAVNVLAALVSLSFNQMLCCEMYMSPQVVIKGSSAELRYSCTDS